MVSLWWGLLDQVFSSATNLGLAVLAGRLTGPSGLGQVYLGFTAVLMAVALQRALVTDPLVVASAHRTGPERVQASRKALTMVLSAAIASTALLVVIGLLIPAPDGQGLLLFAPWMIGASLQEFWRALLFRDGRGAAATLNDGVWAVVMTATVPVLLLFPKPWVIVLTWGAGASVGAGLGFVQTRLMPSGLRGARVWWKAEAWPLARWLAAETILLLVQAQVVVFALAAFVGTDGLGGFRAVLALFAPMTLLTQALAFPGLPLLTRLLQTSPARARLWALRLSGLAVGLLLLYLAGVTLLPHHVLGLVFGATFDRYERLVLPVAAIQVMLASTLGLYLLLKAAGRGGPLFASRLSGAASSLVLTVVLAATRGLTAAAWGMALGTAAGTLALIISTLWPGWRGRRQLGVRV